jgi:hypothetical protein
MFRELKSAITLAFSRSANLPPFFGAKYITIRLHARNTILCFDQDITKTFVLYFFSMAIRCVLSQEMLVFTKVVVVIFIWQKMCLVSGVVDQIVFTKMLTFLYGKKIV